MPRRKEYFVTRESRMRPVHPGALLREDVLPALGISVSRIAREIGVARQTLHRDLAEKGGIPPEMAVRLGRYLGNGAGPLIRMQAAHDLWHAERRLKTAIARIPTRSEKRAA